MPKLATESSLHLKIGDTLLMYPILRRNHFLRWILLKLEGNALQGQNEIPVFNFFLKGQIKIFFEAVVFDRLARVRYRPRGRFRPLGAIEYSAFTKKRQRPRGHVDRYAVISGHEWVFPVTGVLSKQGGSFPVTGGHFFPGNE
jgi:hypothetical protein